MCFLYESVASYFNQNARLQSAPLEAMATPIDETHKMMIELFDEW